MLTIQANKKPITTATPLNTPISPSPNNVPAYHSINHSIKYKYSIETAMRSAGYIPLKRIDNTLQGSVWKVSTGDKIYVIKATNKKLHKKHITKQGGEEIHISENIIKEKTILKYLSSFTPPLSLAKYISFFFDKYNYFLVMEYGGQMSLFDFVKICHQYITEGIVGITTWQTFCKIAMKQIVDLIYWLHVEMHCTHLDLSLENLVIDNVMVIQQKGSKQITFSSEFQIRLIDFGLSEVFYTRNENNDIDFTCKKNAGKLQYKAPKVYRKQPYDARKADCYSLGVVFFIMIIGAPPYSKPLMKDITFNMIINGKLKDVLFEWNKMEYVTPQIISLLSSLLQNEKYRLTIKDLKIHPFLL